MSLEEPLNKKIDKKEINIKDTPWDDILETEKEKREKIKKGEERKKRSVKRQLKKLDEGETIDFSLSNGQLRSSKEIYRENKWDQLEDKNKYCIRHSIDDSVTKFDREGIKEVLNGKRDCWDSNICSATRSIK